jgi:CheY-like chemotaxis protein
VDELEIVLVEDDEIDAEAVRRALRRRDLPCRLHLFRDGDEVLEAAQRGELPRSCFFVIDLNLPRLPGLRLLESLRQASYLSRGEAAVFSTSSAESDRARARGLGARAYLTKSDGTSLGRLIDLMEDFAARRGIPAT